MRDAGVYRCPLVWRLLRTFAKQELAHGTLARLADSFQAGSPGPNARCRGIRRPVVYRLFGSDPIDNLGESFLPPHRCRL